MERQYMKINVLVDGHDVKKNITISRASSTALFINHLLNTRIIRNTHVSVFSHSFQKLHPKSKLSQFVKDGDTIFIKKKPSKECQRNDRHATRNGKEFTCLKRKGPHIDRNRNKKPRLRLTLRVRDGLKTGDSLVKKDGNYLSGNAHLKRAETQRTNSHTSGTTATGKKVQPNLLPTSLSTSKTSCNASDVFVKHSKNIVKKNGDLILRKGNCTMVNKDTGSKQNDTVKATNILKVKTGNIESKGVFTKTLSKKSSLHTTTKPQQREERNNTEKTFDDKRMISDVKSRKEDPMKKIEVRITNHRTDTHNITDQCGIQTQGGKKKGDDERTDAHKIRELPKTNVNRIGCHGDSSVTRNKVVSGFKEQTDQRGIQTQGAKTNGDDDDDVMIVDVIGEKDISKEKIICNMKGIFQKKFQKKEGLNLKMVFEELQKIFKKDLKERYSFIQTVYNDLKQRPGLWMTDPNTQKKATIVTIGNYELTADDMKTLQENKWLNDNVMNGYLALLAIKYKDVFIYSTYFYTHLRKKGFQAVKKWTKKVDIFKKRLLLFPIHVNNHWTLVSCRLSDKSLMHLDSISGFKKTCLQQLVSYLKNTACHRSQDDMVSGWQVSHMKSIPMQTIPGDCGVFVCQYAKHLCQNTSMEFSQKDIPKLRLQMRQELTNKQLM